VIFDEKHSPDGMYLENANSAKNGLLDIRVDNSVPVCYNLIVNLTSKERTIHDGKLNDIYQTNKNKDNVIWQDKIFSLHRHRA